MKILKTLFKLIKRSELSQNEDGTIRQILQMVPPTRRWRLILLTLAQAFASILDLIGVLGFGILSAIVLGGGNYEPKVIAILQLLGLSAQVTSQEIVLLSLGVAFFWH